MQVSIVGQQQDAAAILQEVIASDDWDLRASYVSGPLADALARLPFRVREATTVEEACVAGETGLVVVAHTNAEESLRLVRVAVQSGHHVLVLAPDDVSPAWGFELQLIQDESSSTVIPDSGLFRVTPEEAASLRTRSAATPQQITLDLTVSESAVVSPARSQRHALELALASGGRYSSVIAIDQRTPQGELIQRTLTLGTSKESDSSVPATEIVLRTDTDTADDRITVRQADGSDTAISVNAAPQYLLWCSEFMRSRQAAQQRMSDFAMMLELNYAVDRSLKRRRAIDVYFESGSERSVFKSQMTAIGCLVLILMMLGLIGYLILAQLFELPDHVMRIVRALWIAPAVLYLLAQLLLPIARDRSGRK